QGVHGGHGERAGRAPEAAGDRARRARRTAAVAVGVVAGAGGGAAGAGVGGAEVVGVAVSRRRELFTQGQRHAAGAMFSRSLYPRLPPSKGTLPLAISPV